MLTGHTTFQTLTPLQVPQLPAAFQIKGRAGVTNQVGQQSVLRSGHITRSDMHYQLQQLLLNQRCGERGGGLGFNCGLIRVSHTHMAKVQLWRYSA